MNIFTDINMKKLGLKVILIIGCQYLKYSLRYETFFKVNSQNFIYLTLVVVICGKFHQL